MHLWSSWAKVFVFFFSSIKFIKRPVFIRPCSIHSLIDGWRRNLYPACSRFEASVLSRLVSPSRVLDRYFFYTLSSIVLFQLYSNINFHLSQPKNKHVLGPSHRYISYFPELKIPMRGAISRIYPNTSSRYSTFFLPILSIFEFIYFEFRFTFQTITIWKWKDPRSVPVLVIRYSGQG